MTICRKIALAFEAYSACDAANNTEWRENHRKTITDLCYNGPSGSGIDNDTHFDFFESKSEKLVFHADYHHMNEYGYYDGWTNHTIIVTPSLKYGFNLRVTGRDRNNIKEYLAEVYSHWLSTEIE